MASRKTVLIASTMMCLCIAVAGLTWGEGPTLNVAPGASPLAATKLLQAPSISLNKTVGLAPGVCAATDSITVSTGTQVYYCFVATNTGTVTFNYHSLVDDHLGVVLNNFNYALAPGASSPEVIVPSVASGPVTNTGTWTAADVVGGYSVDDTIPYNFEDISGTGTAIALTDDSIEQFPIGFTFDYYGSVYTSFYASSNGFLADNGTTNGCCTGGSLPGTSTPNGTIAGWWEDLNPSAGGTVHYQTMGTAPNRYVIVQYTAIQHYSSGNPVTMQFKLFETSNVIEVHYQAAPSDGGTHSAGIENQDGTVGLQYYLGTAALSTPLAVRYSPAPALEATDTDTATVNISDPTIDVSPASLASTQLPNTTAQRTLTIGNTGTADLVWNLDEAPPIEIPASDGSFPRGKAAPSFGPPPAEALPTAAPGVPDPDVLRQVGTWGFSTDASNSTHIYFDSDSPGTLVSLGAASGAVWAGDFVGSDLTKTYVIRDDNTLITVDATSGVETTLGTLAAPTGGETYTGMTYDPSTGNVYATSCNITTSSLFLVDVVSVTSTRIGAITNSPCSIGIAADDAGNVYSYDLVNDTLLSINTATGAGTVIGSIGFDANFGQGMDYDSASTTMYMAAFNNATFQAELRAVDLTTGNSTLVGVLGTPSVTQLGYVAWQSGGPCSSPADLPWLSVTPTAGTVPPSGSTGLGVTFDSTGLALGVYDGVLCVHSNDPVTPLVEVPAAMTVSQTAPSISVGKTVGTTAGVCATSSNITVPQGSTVYYCYTVTNTGDTAFAMHDLVDDQLGTIFSGLAYALAPGASIDTVTAGLSVSAVINVPTTNVGTWTAYNAAAGDGVQGQATATVNVTAAEAIPTLHGLGLLILVLLLAGAGVLALRRLS